jgi:hypothetical protein
MVSHMIIMDSIMEEYHQIVSDKKVIEKDHYSKVTFQNQCTPSPSLQCSWLESC